MTAFKQTDKPLIGERKEKNRIASLNSRNRAKALDAELDRRLEVLEQVLRPSFTPKFDFDFPEDDEMCVFGEGSGIFKLTDFGWKKV